MKANLLLVILALTLCLSPVACRGAKPAPAGNSEVDCSQSEPHPMAVGIADRYGISADLVMSWACDGQPFEDILLALETSKLSGRSVEELLAMKDDVGWDETWSRIGLYPQTP
jgi:hypothetical protein